MKDKKKIIMIALSILVCIMSVGYATLAQQINITGTASIDSTWKIEITNITEKNIVGDASSKLVPSYTATTANFNAGLINPGDSITYDVEVSNLGTLKAKVAGINIITSNNDVIIYTVSGIKTGDKLGVGEKDILTIKVEYNSNITGQPDITTSNISIIIDYVQDIGEEAEVNPSPSPEYQTYSVGDMITFAGSNWYVIKDSSKDEDYVTLLKEKILTNSELGEYAANETRKCTALDVTDGTYGCIIEGETVIIAASDKMQYYWSDTCHYSGYYGYTDWDTSECDGHNDYDGSKVREMLETQYLLTLGIDNLKEIDGYKIRLITLEELKNNFGYILVESNSPYYKHTPGVTPSWIFQKTGANNLGTPYWTMTPYPDNPRYVWLMLSTGKVNYLGDVMFTQSVRPVINLLKSSI